MKKIHTRKLHSCLACGAGLSAPLLKLPNMPEGAQIMPSEEELAADKGIDLELCRCPECGLVQFDCEPVDYYRDAIRVVGLSDTMKQLRRDDYAHLCDSYGMSGKKWIECGCGNGDFLKVLSEFDVDIYGIEHGEGEYREAVDKLCGEGGIDSSHIMQMFPDSADIDIPGAPFDVFTSFNFLEHQPDPVSMLCCMHRNLADGGMGIITVPSFEYIINEGRYYELIRDHIANYDLSALVKLCIRCGFEVLEQGYIGIGDTIRVIVRKVSDADVCRAEACTAECVKDSVTVAADNVKSGVNGCPIHAANDAVLYHDNEEAEIPQMNIAALADDYERMSSELAGYMGDLARKGRNAAMWGAGHQGFTIASTTVLGEYVKYIIDSSPRKQGRYAPASHLRIVSPDEYLTDPVDVIIIAAPGYVREIEQSIRSRYDGTAAGVPAVCSILDLTER